MEKRKVILFYRQLKVTHVIENEHYDYFILKGIHNGKTYDKRIICEISAVDEFINIIKLDSLWQLAELKNNKKKEYDRLRKRATRLLNKNNKINKALK